MHPTGSAQPGRQKSRTHLYSPHTRPAAGPTHRLAGLARTRAHKGLQALDHADWPGAAWPDPGSRLRVRPARHRQKRAAAHARAPEQQRPMCISQPAASARAAARAVTSAQEIRHRNTARCAPPRRRRACPAQRPARTPARFRAWAKPCARAHARALGALTHHGAACRAGAEQPRCWAHDSAAAFWARAQRLPWRAGGTEVTVTSLK